MQAVVFEDASIVPDGFYVYICDGRLAEVERTTAGFVQQTIHGGKRLSGVERVRRESPVGRQTAWRPHVGKTEGSVS
jgi:hypothetical protein